MILQNEPQGRYGERRSHFRGRSTTGRSVEVRYRRADGSATVTGKADSQTVTANIGAGGAFLLTESPESVGSALEVSITVPGRAGEMAVRAAVRWVSVRSESTSAGMGVQFASLKAGELLLLREYFSSLGPAS